MSNFRKINGNFVVASRQIAQDERLTWKARGIFLYLASMNDDWNFYVDEIAKHAPQGKEALQGGLKELEKYGYLKRIRTRKEKGHLSTFNWELYFNPVCLQQENPSEGKTLQQGNPPLINNNNNKKQITINNNNNNHNNSIDINNNIDTNKNELGGCGCVFEFFEKNVGMLSPFLREDIQYEYSDWLKLNEKEAGAILIKAMEFAVAAQAKQKWPYAKAILKAWKERNIHTLNAIKLDNEKNSKPRKATKPKDTNRKYHF